MEVGHRLVLGSDVPFTSTLCGWRVCTDLSYSESGVGCSFHFNLVGPSPRETDYFSGWGGGNV